MRWLVVLLLNVVVVSSSNAERSFRGLELTREQRLKMFALRDEKAGTRRMRDDIAEERKKLFDLMLDRRRSREEIVHQVERVNALMAELNVRRVDLLLKVRDVLTDEQLAVIEKRRQERRLKGKKDGGQ